MTVVDCSATIAIALIGSDRSVISAVNAHEMAVVLGRRIGNSAIDLTWAFLAEYGIEVVPFDEVQAKLAAAAYDRYGKGMDSQAKLNLADCAASALAKSLGAPLLFKGQDFAATDIQI